MRLVPSSPSPASARRWVAASATLWFCVALVGQGVFAASVASFYGLSAMRGHWESWNRSMPRGHVAGDPVGNGVVAIHLLAATLVVIGGALQLVPRIRRTAPAFHRWNGRVYLVFAVLASVVGTFMAWRAGAVGDTAQHLASTLNAALVLSFAAMACRTAVARDLVRHRRWALRLYMVVLGVWFFRLEVASWTGVFGGPYGFDPTTFSGPALTGLAFADFLLPLAAVELYWRATDRPGGARRVATAALLLCLTLLTGLGSLAAAMGSWVPTLRAAFDSRKPIVEDLTAVLSTSGIDAAITRYRTLKATSPAGLYNFDEGQLNRLGYALVRQRRLPEAIRVFELNAESFPRSSNVHDSLGEAYLAAGRRTEAVEQYRRALALDPTAAGSAEMLRRLEAK